MAISAPVVTCAHSSAGSKCVAYVPANAARLSELPGDTAASRPAVFTCARIRRPVSRHSLFLPVAVVANSDEPYILIQGSGCEH